MENKHEVSVIILLMNSNKKRTYISHCICISKTNSPTSRVETWYFLFYFLPFFIKTSLYDSIADRQQQPPRSSKWSFALLPFSVTWKVDALSRDGKTLHFSATFRCFTSAESVHTGDERKIWAEIVTRETGPVVIGDSRTLLRMWIEWLDRSKTW